MARDSEGGRRRTVEVIMAALTEGGWLARLMPSRRAQTRQARVQQSGKVYEFAERAYRKTGGATPDLKRVYKAYLDNQKKNHT